MLGRQLVQPAVPAPRVVDDEHVERPERVAALEFTVHARSIAVCDDRVVTVDLSGASLDRFLAGPFLATLATYRRDGTVLLSPVWQEWRDGCFHLTISHGDIKVTHVRADPRVVIVVAEHTTPYRGVEASGTAELLGEGYPALAERMVERYLGGVFPEELDRDGHVLRLKPERLRAWSFADWFG